MKQIVRISVSFSQLKVAQLEQPGSLESGVGIRTLTINTPGLTSFYY